MAYNAKKTEHAGPKKGGGAFYGRKAFAKKASNRRRREADKQAASNQQSSPAFWKLIQERRNQPTVSLRELKTRLKRRKG